MGATDRSAGDHCQQGDEVTGNQEQTAKKRLANQ